MPAAHTAPSSQQEHLDRSTNQTPTVCIIGGGFSGAMTAANLLRQARERSIAVRVVLVERRGEVGKGIAYGTLDDRHLLNVPAGKMSAWADDPDDFVRWAARSNRPLAPYAFASRRLYGQYVQETLQQACAGQTNFRSFEIVNCEARRVVRQPDLKQPGKDSWIVEFDSAAPVQARAVVLALGHDAPADPLQGRWTGSRARWIADPWNSGALARVQPNEPVILLGTGLTSVDIVLTLSGMSDDSGGARRTAPIWMISRRGLLSSAHSPAPAPPADISAMLSGLFEHSQRLTLRALLRAVRSRVDELPPDGNWRTVIDALRPHAHRLWNALDSTQRRRFLSRVRPVWDVLRHRMPHAVAERLETLRASGRLHILAGQVDHASGRDDGVELVIRRKPDGSQLNLNAAWVFNCTGPLPTNRPESNPVVASLLRAGLIVPDDLAIGIQTTPSGACISRDGRELPSLRVIGPLRKPDSWESLAVPELRIQAKETAEHVLGFI